jgi:protein-tyrosine phosphatase
MISKEIYSCIEQPYLNKGGLYIGSLESIETQILNKLKITYILSLVNIPEKDKVTIKKLNINHLIIVCQDRSDFRISQNFENFANFIRKGINQGNVLVHCREGISRSATAIIAFFLKFKNMTMEGSIVHISRFRTSIYPNEGFQNQLKEYENELNHSKYLL